MPAGGQSRAGGGWWQSRQSDGCTTAPAKPSRWWCVHRGRQSAPRSGLPPVLRRSNSRRIHPPWAPSGNERPPNTATQPRHGACRGQRAAARGLERPPAADAGRDFVRTRPPTLLRVPGRPAWCAWDFSPSSGQRQLPPPSPSPPRRLSCGVSRVPSSRVPLSPAGRRGHPWIGVAPLRHCPRGLAGRGAHAVASPRPRIVRMSHHASWRTVRIGAASHRERGKRPALRTRRASRGSQFSAPMGGRPRAARGAAFILSMGGSQSGGHAINAAKTSV